MDRRQVHGNRFCKDRLRILLARHFFVGSKNPAGWMKPRFDQKFISQPSAGVFPERILAARIVFQLRTRFATAHLGWMMKSKFCGRVSLFPLADWLSSNSSTARNWRK